MYRKQTFVYLDAPDFDVAEVSISGIVIGVTDEEANMAGARGRIIDLHQIALIDIQVEHCMLGDNRQRIALARTLDGIADPAANDAWTLNIIWTRGSQEIAIIG